MLRCDNFYNDVKTEKDYESTQKAMEKLIEEFMDNGEWGWRIFVKPLLCFKL